MPAEVRAHVLSTNITLDEATCSIDLARQTATDFFALPINRADEIIVEVASAVSTWREVAARKGAKKFEIERMASAFEHDELRNAMKLGAGTRRGRRRGDRNRPADDRLDALIQHGLCCLLRPSGKAKR